MRKRTLTGHQKAYLDQAHILECQKLSHIHDLDNLVKPILDSMKKIGMITDDAEIFHLDVTKFPTMEKKKSNWS